MGKRVAIVQSCYLPWKGYFDLIRLVDEFILYDDVQYTSRDWRNRNQVKSPTGRIWLTVPVHVERAHEQLIQEVQVSDQAWRRKHWKTLVHCYARAPHFRAYADRIEALLLEGDEIYLSRINHHLLGGICGLLGIGTRLRWSTDSRGEGSKTERLVSLCRQAGATTYLSGPSAQAYIDVAQFAAAGIALEYMDYEGYPEYEQLYPPFEHHVSFVDLLFHTGGDARRCMKALRVGPTSALGSIGGEIRGVDSVASRWRRPEAPSKAAM